MNGILRKSIAFTIVVLMIAVPCSAAAENEGIEVSAGTMAADALIVRPLGLAAIVVGTAIFIVSLPFSALGGNTSEAARKLMGEPVAYTFKRPLGDLDMAY